MFSCLRSPAASLLLIYALLTTCCLAGTFLAEGYAVRVWQTEDGLPQNMVTSAVQTHDGYLWFGTYNGLARFDGARFRLFDSASTPGLVDRRIASLFVDEHGTLWIGHESGTITRYREGRFEPFSISTGNMGEKVTNLGSDEQGQLWAMRHAGAIDAVGGKNLHLPALIAPAIPNVIAWTRSARGSIWVAEDGQAARLMNGKLEPLHLPTPRVTNHVAGIATAADGGVWILCDERIRKWENGRWTEDRGEFPWPRNTLSCSLELRDGTLAVGTIYSGLYLIFPDGRPPAHFDRNNGLPQNWVRFLHEDREGNLWLGAGTAGVASIRPSAFSVLNSPDQWQGCTVLSVAPDRDGALWIGTDGAKLYHYKAGKWGHYGEADGLPSWYIPAVATNQAGDVWVGQFWWGSPFRWEKGRFVRPKPIDDASSPVFALLATPESRDLLVGNREGLLQLKDDRATWLIKLRDGSAGAACAIAQDRQGGIWCGFGEGGLAYLSPDEKLSWFRRQDGLASDSVQCLRLDDDGTLWIGTADGGLSRFKNGQFATLGVAQGLSDKFIGYILDDGLGYLWLSTHHGLQRVAKSELNRCADGAISTVSSQTYDHSDGLPTIEFTGGLQSAGCQTPDGRLWFASSKGLLSVDPKRIQANPLPPPVLIESLLVDGKNVPVTDAAAPARLAPDHERLEFHFSGLSFVAPNKVLFKYRLEGIDKTWIDAGSKRTAFYSRLSAGTYRFRAIACNNDGVWNDDGASLAFTVAPFFWETWWFLGACGLAAMAALTWIVRTLTRRRMQRRVEQLERQNAVERERARIAQDIHDDIGSSLSRITMLSQPAHTELAEPEHATVLSRIYSTAREITCALDEIVWAVDPRQDTLDALVDYMGTFAQEILTVANIRCRLDLPASIPAWPLTAETRHNLFLAFKEALNNTIKHAAATEVRISVRLQPGSFVLTIKDNGRGFAPAPRPPSSPGRASSGNGLLNMKTRLARIGGRCEISTESHEGTRVSFIVGAQDHPPASPPSTAVHR